jgi:homoserine O-acetyltransferase/O-succinyltransferase
VNAVDSTTGRRDGHHVISNFVFEHGGRLDEMTVGYATFGELNRARDNAILLCHGAGSDRNWALEFIREGGAFDPTRYFVVSVDAVGGGESSKPSDGLGLDFPSYTIADMVAAQASLVMEGLDLPQLHAVAGPSMGSFVGVEWAAQHPGFAQNLALWVPSVRCDGAARALFEALEAVITLDPGYQAGRYGSRPTEGIRRTGMVIAPYVLSRALLDDLSADVTQRLKLSLGDRYAESWDPIDLIWRYRAVGSCDLEASYGGLAALARRVKCPTLLIPCTSDQLFPLESTREFAELLPHGRLVPLVSDWGHMAGAQPAGSPEFELLDRATAEFLQSADDAKEVD